MSAFVAFIAVVLVVVASVASGAPTAALPTASTASRQRHYLFDLSGGSALMPRLRPAAQPARKLKQKHKLPSEQEEATTSNDRLVLTPEALERLIYLHHQRHNRPKSIKRSSSEAIPEIDLSDLLGVDGKTPIDVGDLAGEETILDAPIPFSRTSPEWKLAVISFLLNMKAHGLNIDLVDTGVRKKVGARYTYVRGKNVML